MENMKNRAVCQAFCGVQGDFLGICFHGLTTVLGHDFPLTTRRSGVERTADHKPVRSELVLIAETVEEL